MGIQTKKTAVLETVDILLSKAKVTKKLRGNIINRVANGLNSYDGEFVDSEFVYELIYAFKVLIQHGLSHYGKRPGRKFEPVDIETFVCGSLYMDQKEYVRPAILHHLKRLFSEEFEHCYEVCLAGDTKVPMADGTFPTIKELAEPKQQKDVFWVYSEDSNGDFVAAEAKNPKCYGVRNIWRTTFTDGTYIETDGDHEFFINKTGRRVRVRDLKSGDHLRSFYARLERMSRGRNCSKYWKVSSKKGNNRLEPTEQTIHRLVAKSFYKDITGQTIHHINFNSQDNRPENLRPMVPREHARFHSELGRRNLLAYRATVPASVFSERARKTITEYNSNTPFSVRSARGVLNGAKGGKVRWSTIGQRYAASVRMTKRNLAGNAQKATKAFWDSFRGSKRKGELAGKMAAFNKYSHPNLRSDLSTLELKKAAPHCLAFGDLPLWLDCSVTTVYRLLRELGMSYKEFRNEYMPCAKGQHHRVHSNHTVLRVERTSRVESVYCLTVPKHGNFFVQCKNAPKGRINAIKSTNCEAGAIGYGKNYFADMAQAYILYNLSSFYSPQVEFGLAPGSDIIMMQQSVTTKLAKKVVFGQFGSRIALSPYFANHFPFDKRVRTELRFPDGITVMPISSSSTAALSMNIYGGCFPASQTFMTESGMGLLSDVECVPDCLTIDEDSNIYPVSVNTLCTGYKPLIKMYLNNGEHIVGTPDQQFKTENGIWLEAIRAAGHFFVFVKGSQIQKVRCARVRLLNTNALVYDVEHVPGTHAFLTPTSGGEGSLVAHNCIDELSFMQKVKRSKRAEAGDLDYDQAEKLYNVVLRRMESRSIILGRIPGKLFLLGSANYVGDFIDRKLNEVKLLKDRGKSCPTYVMQMAQWEAYPEGTFCGDTFKLVLPSEKTAGAIITDEEEIDEDAEIKEIPIEYKSKFERDFEGSLKDIAGIPVGRLGRFIRDVRKVYVCAEKHEELFDGGQLFTTDEISQKQWRNIDDIIDFAYINNHIDKDARLGAHIDLAITGDCCGIGIGRVIGFVQLKDNVPVTSGASNLGVLPIVAIDGTLSVLPPPGGEINLFMVRDLILRLKELINLVFANLDSYESAMMIQSFRQNRISSHVLSVDRTPEPYKDTKDAALGGRLLIPNSPKLIREFKMLGFDRAANKIDHLAEESKDMADCVAGVVSVFSNLRSSFRGTGTGRPVGTARPQGTALPTAKTTGRRIQIGELL